MLSILLLLASPEIPELPDCDQNAADEGIQWAMNQCAHREFLIADAELNAQWKLTRAEMKRSDDNWDDSARTAFPSNGPGYFETMLEAQRAWLTFREAHCRSEGYLARGGSIEPLFVSMCMTDLTKARTKQLRDLANWPD